MKKILLLGVVVGYLLAMFPFLGWLESRDTQIVRSQDVLSGIYKNLGSCNPGESVCLEIVNTLPWIDFCAPRSFQVKYASGRRDSTFIHYNKDSWFANGRASLAKAHMVDGSPAVSFMLSTFVRGGLDPESGLTYIEIKPSSPSEWVKVSMLDYLGEWYSDFGPFSRHAKLCT